MDVYVACRWDSRFVRVPQAMKVLAEAGHRITFDWTKTVEKVLPNTDERHVYQGICALEDEEGVRAADAIVVLDDEGGKGMFFEMGLARAWGLHIIVVARVNELFIFHDLPQVRHVVSVEEAALLLTHLDKVEKDREVSS